MKQFLFLFFILFSCTKFSDVKENISGGHFISPHPLEINSAENVAWNVGKQKLEVLSKGVLVIFTLPQFESDHLKELITKYRFDSWLFSIIQDRGGSQRRIQNFYIPFSYRDSSRMK